MSSIRCLRWSLSLSLALPVIYARQTEEAGSCVLGSRFSVLVLECLLCSFPSSSARQMGWILVNSHGRFCTHFTIHFYGSSSFRMLVEILAENPKSASKCPLGLCLAAAFMYIVICGKVTERYPQIIPIGTVAPSAAILVSAPFRRPNTGLRPTKWVGYASQFISQNGCLAAERS